VMDLETEHPGVKQSMLKALSNVAPRHLLDTRLNPPAELRACARPVPVDRATTEDPQEAEIRPGTGSKPRVLRVLHEGELSQMS
jgi:hypothetical protein